MGLVGIHSEAREKLKTNKMKNKELLWAEKKGEEEEEEIQGPIIDTHAWDLLDALEEGRGKEML